MTQKINPLPSPGGRQQSHPHLPRTMRQAASLLWLGLQQLEQVQELHPKRHLAAQLLLQQQQDLPLQEQDLQLQDLQVQEQEDGRHHSRSGA